MARERDGENKPGAAPDPRPVSRRAFLRLAGTAAAAGSSGCFQIQPESALPATLPVEGRTPGKPQTFATTWSHQGAGIGLHVQSWEGRPTKVEGNPRHPASLGAAGAFEQALILQLYSDQRPTQVLNGDEPIDLRGYLASQDERARQLERLQGQALRILVRPSASPSVVRLRQLIRQRYPKSRQYAWDALSRQNSYRGAALAFGRPLESLPRFSEARTVVFLDADPLGSGPWRLAAARDLVHAREPGPTMIRLYSVEPTPTVTGMYTDHRIPVRASEIGRFARALARNLAGQGAASKLSWAKELQDWPEHARWLHAMAQDLARAGDRGWVLAGPSAPPEIVALAHAMNDALGSAARVGRFLEPSIDGLDSGPEGLRDLTRELASGSIDTLIITAFDPVYNAPSDVDLAGVLAKVPNSIYWSSSAHDVTSRHVRWVVPALTALESWGDERALDGTASLTQPLVAPLFPGATELDVLAPFAGQAQRTPREMVVEGWRQQRPSQDFARQFDRWLQQGVIPDTALPNAQASVDHARVRDAVRAQAQKEARAAGLAIHFFESPATADGRFAHNPWLVEFPDPATSQVWGNAARMSPSTAQRLGVATGEEVALILRGRRLALPAMVVAGQADETVSVALGWGRPGPEPMPGTVAGANAASLRTTSEFWHCAGLAVERNSEPVAFAMVQPHLREEGRPIAFAMSWKTMQREGAALLHEHKGPVEKLYNPFGYTDVEYKWAMAIDLNRCIGCGACVVACYAENNIPVVGLEDCRRGRDMRWLRVDRYLQGSAASPEFVHMPLMCVHCEAAPCEYVCPVFATVHSSEGLNQMVYNRCVGTRFCSNNCPYKIRRFNWRGYTRHYGPLKRAAMNPDVSVRPQGVIEKCTYCVQRIERARIDARIAGKGIDTSKLQTACAQTCPTHAIVFGSLHDEHSEVARLHKDPRHYFLLQDRGTRPRTAHLARIKNPSEEA